MAMGSAYKGFDDAEAGWGKGRVIEQQCGHTWLSTFAEISRFYSVKNQLRALMIPSWNDYEEGTEIETGVENCVQVQGRLTEEISAGAFRVQRTPLIITRFLRNVAPNGSKRLMFDLASIR